MVTLNSDKLGEIVFYTWQASTIKDSSLRYEDLNEEEKNLYKFIGMEISLYVIERVEQEKTSITPNTEELAITIVDPNEDPSNLSTLESATVEQIEKKLAYFTDAHLATKEVCTNLHEYLQQRKGCLPISTDTLYDLLEKRLGYIPTEFLRNMSSLYITKKREEVESRIKDLEFLYQRGVDKENHTFFELNIAHFVMRLLLVYEL